jgi:hypothetical protein
MTDQPTDRAEELRIVKANYLVPAPVPIKKMTDLELGKLIGLGQGLELYAKGETAQANIRRKREKYEAEWTRRYAEREAAEARVTELEEIQRGSHRAEELRKLSFEELIERAVQHRVWLRATQSFPNLGSPLDIEKGAEIQAEWDRRCAEREAEQAELERQCEAAESRVAELAGEMSSAWAELPVIREQEPRANLSLPQQCRVVAEVYTHQERRAEAAEAEVKRLRERWTKYGVTVLDQPLTDALTQRLRDATDRAEAAEARVAELEEIQRVTESNREGFKALATQYLDRAKKAEAELERLAEALQRIKTALDELEKDN